MNDKSLKQVHRFSDAPVSEYIFSKIQHLEALLSKGGVVGYYSGSNEASLNEKIKMIANQFPKEFTSLTGIETKVPPENIHRMQRYDKLWIGDLYTANLVINCLASAGTDISDARLLDLGCSSGSLTRVLAALPMFESIFGCDPIDSAIDWASQYLPGSYHRMSNKPPLVFVPEFFDFVTAISVFSHHSPSATQLWLAEVSRVLKPNGFFLLTYCSEVHLQWSRKGNKRTDIIHDEIEYCIESCGNYFKAINYAAEENPTDDTWGHSVWASMEFKKECSKYFEIVGEYKGANQGNQDVLILRKK